jgi:hypothetical protein
MTNQNANYSNTQIYSKTLAGPRENFPTNHLYTNSKKTNSHLQQELDDDDASQTTKVCNHHTQFRCTRSRQPTGCPTGFKFMAPVMPAAPSLHMGGLNAVLLSDI